MSKNNFWAEFDSGFENKQVTNNFWAEFDNPQETTGSNEPSIGQRIASGAKAITAGVAGAIPDTLSLAYNLPAMAQNVQVAAGNYQANPYAFDFAPAEEMTAPVPLIPSATEAIDQGIDTVTGGYTITPEDQKYINEGLKTGASFLTGGGLAKTAQGGVAKLGSMIGNTSPLQAAGAAAMGGTTSYLADQGAGTGEAIGGGLAANLAVNAAPSLAKGAGGLAGRAALSAVGLGKNKLNLEAAKAAQGLDIALPKAAASEGKAIALADQFLSKTPVASGVMSKRYSDMADKVMKELDKAYDSALPAAERVGVEDKIRQLYSNARESLPSEAQIVPRNVTSVTEQVKAELAKSASLSAGEKKVLSIIKDYEDKFVPMGIKRIPSPVEDLVASQDSLGKVVDWKDTSVNWQKEKKAAAMVKRLYNAISNDLEQYGKTNPEWYNYQKEADKLFTKLSRRKELEDMFGAVENTATGEMSYNSLSKILNDEQNRARLQKITNPETFDRLDKLSKVARAMAIKNKNIPNPSGTAVTQKTFDLISILTGASAVVAPEKTALAVIGGSGLAHLLTDKKTLDLAIKFAETPININAVEFGKRMKQITGYTPVTALREAQKLEQGQEQTSGEVKSGEPAKKAPAFNKTIEDMYNNKYIRNFIEAD
ncbi:MAG: hypothetical protein FJX70_06730 [Alphaproteobacteria bacterium]|nr:hypothetical protein [Alphaproteobacteria bacterium]